MSEVILETRIPAHDPSRVYYVAPDGMAVDLPPGLSQKPQRYVIATDRTPNDPARVYLHDTQDDIFWDVDPAIAERYARPVVSIGPQAIATLGLLLCPPNQ